MQVEAGVRTSTVHRLTREIGPLSARPRGHNSQIGGNVASNAGRPHGFKYSVTGARVTGLEAVIPPGDLITVGGAVRKDVAGYDVNTFIVGPEGTLAIITAAWLRLVPALEVALPVVGLYPDLDAGVGAIEAVLANGIAASALEHLNVELSPPPLRDSQ